MKTFAPIKSVAAVAVALATFTLGSLAGEPARESGASAASQPIRWEPIGLSGGGGMFSPAISPANPDLMMLNCDMSAAYLTEDGGRNWRMIHRAQLRSDTACRPAFHPTDPDIIYASSGGRLRISRDRGRTFAALGDLKESLAGEIAINSADPNVFHRLAQRTMLSRMRKHRTACPGPADE